MPTTMRTVVLDSAVLSALAQRDPRAVAFLRATTISGTSLVTTAANLTEVLRGAPRDAAVHRLLDSVSIRVIDADIATAAGARIGRTRTRGNVTIDALVAEVAGREPGPVAVMTADSKDLGALVDPAVALLLL